MSADLKEALTRAALELGRDAARGELEALREDLRGSVLAQVGGFALMRAKCIREDRPDGKLTPADLASIIEQLPSVARAARAAQENGGPDGTG